MEHICINIKQAAELLGVSPPTLRRMARIEGFPAVKIGGRVLVHREGLAQWIADKTREGGEIQ